MIMNFFKKYWQKLVLFSYFFLLPVVSFAQSSNVTPKNPCTLGKICNPITTNNLNDLIRVLLQGILKIGMPIVALAIIYCGFLFVSARGSTEKLGEAKKALFNTLIGATVLLGSWAIAELIAHTVQSLS